ncbi:MAG: stage III sporulation protein AE [Ruminococcus sp.]|nr:stage III sporulation protein AE [Ruminococcus sp.]
MRKVKIFAICVLIILSFSVNAYAAGESEYYNGQVESSGAEDILSGLDSETKERLGELGIEDVNFSSLFDVSFSKIFSFVKKAAEGKLESPLKSLMKLLSVIILIAVCESFMPDDDKMKNVINMAAVLFSVTVIISPLYDAMESAVSSVGVCADFMKSLIPVLVGIVSASGNPSLAVSFQSCAFAAAEVISALGKNYVVPIVGAVTALDLTGSLMPSMKLSGITELVKKTVIQTLSFTATLYVSFLGIKGALANAADTVASKGIKLVISSAVPIVGGAVSEAYSGIIGSLVLVKSTVGIFGIIVIAVITVPSMLQLLFWIFALKLGAAAGEVFSLGGVSSLLKALSCAITLLNVVILFGAVLFIISLALLLSLKK